MKVAFLKDKYIKLQSESILDRINKFGNKLYLEFGGWLFDDKHASRVLPGFLPNLKIELLESLKDKIEVLFAICADDIEKSKARGDSGITYDLELLKSIDKLRKKGLDINGVVITKFNNQSNLGPFIKNLINHNIKVYKHHYINNYPYDIDTVLSSEGFGKNDYIKTKKPIIMVTSPGANSGKLSVCLSQIYNDWKKGIKSGYAKFETFPIWNLSLKHPVNLAYEASTADIDDINMIDSYHLEAYNISAVSYNRDLEVYPILRKILFNVFGENIYNSPTDMGVNMSGYCISDEKIVEEACKNEIIRRYLNAKVDFKLGKTESSTIDRIKLIMDYLNISVNDREVVEASLKKSHTSNTSAIAIKLKNGDIITGKSSLLMTAPAAMILNTLKHLSGIDDSIYLLSSDILKPLLNFKQKVFKSDVLTLNEILIALNICAQSDKKASKALTNLNELKGLDAHSTCIVNPLDKKILKNLGINYTSEDVFYSDNLYNNE